jgi:hypothetical protein
MWSVADHEHYTTEALKRKRQGKQSGNLCFGVSVSTVDIILNSTWVDLQKVCNRKIQWPTIPVWWQTKGYCSDMPNVVSVIDGTSHEIQIPSNEPQQKTYFQ